MTNSMASCLHLNMSTKWVACSTMGPPDRCASHHAGFWMLL